MDGSLQYFVDEPDRFPFSPSQFLRNIKTEPYTFPEECQFSPSSNIHDSSLLNASLDTYQTDQPIYTNLTPSAVNLPPLYSVPSATDEGLMMPFSVFPLKSEPVSFYDEGIGSSASSNHSLSPPTENRSEKGSDRGSIVDSDFAEGDRVSPGMHPSRFLNPLKQQCVQCGIASISSNDHWVLGTTGHWLCSTCSLPPPPPPKYTESTSNGNTDSNSSNSNGRRKKSTVSAKRGQTTCVNCHTDETSLWRRNPRGEFVCNACGLYEKLHQRNRPLNMKKDTIQRRKRKSRNTDPKKKSETVDTKSPPPRVYQPPALQPTIMFQNLDEGNCYQPLPSHSLISLPPMNNSRNVLFSYTPEPPNQILQTSGLGYSNETSRMLQHLHPSS